MKRDPQSLPRGIHGQNDADSQGSGAPRRIIAGLLCFAFFGAVALLDVHAAHATVFSPRAAHASLTFGGKMWVLGGQLGTPVLSSPYSNEVWSSADGIDWTLEVTAAPWGNLRAFGAVVLAGEMWVLGGNQSNPDMLRNDVWHSPDGVYWTQSTAAAPWAARHYLASVVFQNKIWIMGGEGGGNHQDVWSSPDGVNWTQITPAASWSARHNLGAVVYDNQIWVMGGFDGQFKSDVWKSSDGASWERVTDTAPWGPLYAMDVNAFDGQMFLIGGWNDLPQSGIWSSINGVDWEEITPITELSPIRDASSTVFQNKLWVLGGADGTTANNDVSAIASDDHTAPNAVAIAPATTGPTNANSVSFSVEFDEEVQNFDSASDVIVSHSGTTNTGVAISGGPTNYTVVVTGVSGDGLFALEVDTNSDIQDLGGNYLSSSVVSQEISVDNTPPNAVTITPATTGPTDSDDVAFTITFDEPVEDFNSASDVTLSHSGTSNLGVTITGGPTTYTATVTGILGDGFFTLKLKTTSNVQDPAGNPLFSSVTSESVAIANSAATLFSPRTSHKCLTFAGKMWVLGGDELLEPYSFNSEIWSSTNGADWTLVTATAPWGRLRAFGAVVFNGEMWVLGGNQSSPNVLRNDVWHSNDGLNWTQATAEAPWAARHFLASVVFQDKIWVMGGEGGGNHQDVWSSPDGVNWTQVTPAASWSARHSLGAVVYNNQIWVMGGYDGQSKGDVWKSSDGASWEKVTENAPWGPLSGICVEAFFGKIYLIGGSDNMDNSQVWSSVDGLNWQQLTPLVEFPARTNSSSTLFQDELWIVGGQGDGGAQNDVVAINVIGEGEGEGEGEGPEDFVQTADQNGDFVIDLDELLRVIQFYNSLGFHCASVGEESEDGYIPGDGVNRSCSPYDTDYAPQDWVISLDELLRVIQFYNSLGYNYCPLNGTEDGYCPDSV